MFIYLIKTNTSSLTVKDLNPDRLLPVVLLLIEVLFFADFNLIFFNILAQNARDSLNAKNVKMLFFSSL